MATITAPSSTPSGTPRRNTHRLPGWMAWVQDNVLLSALMLAEAYLLADVFVMGLVGNIESPGTWGIWRGIGVVVFIGAGLSCAGVALRCSATMGECFSEGRWGLGLANLLGLVVFTAVDVWATIVQRAPNLPASRPDLWLLALLNMGGSTITPTLLAIALLIPFAIIFNGLTREEDPAEAAARRELEHAAKMQKTRQSAELRALQVQGWTAAAAGGLQVLRTQLGKGEAIDSGPDNQGPDDGTPASLPSGQDGALSTGKEGPRLRSLPRPDALKGRITKEGLVAWVHDNLGVDISEADALAFIKSQPGSGVTKGIHGQPLSAPKASTLQKAKARWGAQPDTAVSAG